MAIEAFPPVTNADDSGLLAIGGDLDVSSLVLAYKSGIFPWPTEEFDFIPWFAPPRRAVLFFKDFHLPRRLQKELRKQEFDIRIDANCPEVIRRCALTRRKKQRGTWIKQEMVEAYARLHQAGFCHSVESYRDEKLVGGLYGVAIAGMFAGESMFHRETNASKIAFIALVEQLQKRGATWLDCQQLTPLLESFGAREIPREEFSELLAEALKSTRELF